MPRQKTGSEQPPAVASAEAPFDVSRFSSLSEARAYQAWKQDVPTPVRFMVESAMMGKPYQTEPTGLPHVDAFLEALGKQLSDPTKPLPKNLPASLDGLFASLRSIQTDQGAGDGIALLASKEGSFKAKLSIWKDHVLPIISWLKEQDLAPPPDESKGEEALEREEQEADQYPVADEPLIPPPPASAMNMEMQDLEKQEGEPRPFFSVHPFYGGYFREQLFERWNSAMLTWEASPSVQESLPQEPLDTLLVRTLSGAARGGQQMALPLPYDWSIDQDSIQTDAPKEAIHFTHDQHGNVFLLIDTSGVWSYQMRIGRKVRRISRRSSPTAEDQAMQARMPKELKEQVRETAAARLSSKGKADMLVKTVRDHLEYSTDPNMNAVYRSNPAAYFERIWEKKQADCKVSNTEAAAPLRLATIPCRMVGGHYVKIKSKDDRALLTSGTGHAWLEVYDQDTAMWFKADATPKGDPTLDEDRPDEQQESGEGDYGEQEAEIMSDEKLEELIQSLEEAQDKPQEKKTSEERLLEQFVEQAQCSKEEAREVLAAFRRLRELKDAKGERIGQKLITEWKKLVQNRMVKQQVYQGPVRMSEGDDLEDPVAALIDVRSGELDPTGFERIQTIEKREKLFGGLDIYLLIDGSGSMAERDPKSGRIKSELQRDFVMLYVDSLMQCAFLSRQAEGRLTAPLPIRVQVVSIHGSVSVDLPLVDRWSPKEQVALYRSVMRTATNSTPDHAGLMAIEQKILSEREAWKGKTHKPGQKPPLEFVVTTLDGGSDDPASVQAVLGRLRSAGVVDFAYGMTAAAKPIEAIYHPNAKVTEDLSELPCIVTKDTLGVFKTLYPERVKR